MHILIVEDEPKVAGFIKKGLEENGDTVEHAADGMTGRQLALDKHFDLIILDVMLPKLNGFELCRDIRKFKPDVGIIMLTALGSIDDKVNGLNSVLMIILKNRFILKSYWHESAPSKGAAVMRAKKKFITLPIWKWI